MATSKARRTALTARIRHKLAVAKRHLAWAEDDLSYEKWHEAVEQLTALLKANLGEVKK